jgi:hypothetical protein
VREPDLAGEAVRAAERLGGKPGQVLDMAGNALNWSIPIS